MDHSETSTHIVFGSKHYRILVSSTDVAQIKNAFDILKEQINAQQILVEKIGITILANIYKKVQTSDWIDEFLDGIDAVCGPDFGMNIVNVAEKAVDSVPISYNELFCNYLVDE